jgi:hypothetical protein
MPMLPLVMRIAIADGIVTACQCGQGKYKHVLPPADGDPLAAPLKQGRPLSECQFRCVAGARAACLPGCLPGSALLLLQHLAARFAICCILAALLQTAAGSRQQAAATAAAAAAAA